MARFIQRLRGWIEGFIAGKTPLDFLAVALSAVALVISVRGCQIAQNAQSLAGREYREKRLLVLTAKITKAQAKFIQEITLETVDKSLTFLGGTIYFPPSIYRDPVPVRSFGEVLHLGAVSYRLQEVTAQKVPPIEGHVQVGMEGKIPVFIQSSYAAQGELYFDQSLYMLGVDLFVSEEANKLPEITFVDLIFVKRLPADARLRHAELDEIMDSMGGEKGLYMPPRSPG
jgi:hypothetical protein